MGDLILKPASGGDLILQEDGGTAALTIDTDGNITLSGDLVPNTPLSHRNLIINGNFQINQRRQTSGAVAVDTVTYYTVDRWKLATASDTISWSDSGGIRTITIPSGDFLTQVIEGLSIVSGTYVISWAGTATCTVDAVSKSSGDTFTLTAGSNCTVSFTNGTVSKVMVERGSVATPFEHRSFGEELARCQRYTYATGTKASASYDKIGIGTNANSTTCFVQIFFPTTMRTSPDLTLSSSTASHYGLYHQGDLTCNAVPTLNANSTESVGASNWSVASGLLAGGSSVAQENNGTNVYLIWDAEL